MQFDHIWSLIHSTQDIALGYVVFDDGDTKIIAVKRSSLASSLHRSEQTFWLKFYFAKNEYFSVFEKPKYILDKFCLI